MRGKLGNAGWKVSSETNVKKMLEKRKTPGGEWERGKKRNLINGSNSRRKDWGTKKQKAKVKNPEGNWLQKKTNRLTKTTNTSKKKGRTPLKVALNGSSG